MAATSHIEINRKEFRYPTSILHALHRSRVEHRFASTFNSRFDQRWFPEKIFGEEATF